MTLIKIWTGTRQAERAGIKAEPRHVPDWDHGNLIPGSGDIHRGSRSHQVQNRGDWGNSNTTCSERGKSVLGPCQLQRKNAKDFTKITGPLHQQVWQKNCDPGYILTALHPERENNFSSMDNSKQFLLHVIHEAVGSPNCFICAFFVLSGVSKIVKFVLSH